jgi:hypothetical protein
VRDGIFDGLVHFRVRFLESIGFEDGIPSKVRGATSRYDTSRSTAIECHGLAIRASAEGKYTLRVGRLILEASKHLVQAIVSQLCQEPFTILRVKIQS